MQRAMTMMTMTMVCEQWKLVAALICEWMG
jgi:hypothetical protein